MWLYRAWVWLKNNWKTLLIGISTLGIGLLIGRAFKKTPTEVVAPELEGAEEERIRAQELEDAERDQAAVERIRRLKEIESEHSATLSGLTDLQRKAVAELKSDPEKLNDYLLKVGRDVRE